MNKIRLFLAVFFFCQTLLFPLAADFPVGGLLFSGLRNEAWDLFLWQPDGENGSVKALTNSPRVEGNPIFWSRNQLFICSSQDKDGLFVILFLDKTGKEQGIVRSENGNLGWAQPSPWDDNILAVLEDPKTGFTKPGMIRFGENIFRPLRLETSYPAGQPAWIDRNRIFISRFSENHFSLVMYHLETGKEVLIADEGQNWLSAANPSGGPPFFFTRRIGQTSSIFRLFEDPSSSNYWSFEDFTHSRNYDWQPSISPDGTFLVFLSLRNGRFIPIKKNIQTMEEQEIPISGFSKIYHPTWIPPEPLSAREVVR